MNRSVTQLAYTGTSIKFERMEYYQPPAAPESKRPQPLEERSKHLYYIVHPENAQYRTDVPAAYYITSAATETPGNIRFDTSSSKRPLQNKREFKALLSAGKHMWNEPLFNEEKNDTPLFTVKQSWKGGGYKWTTISDARQVAVEDGKGEEPRLIVSTPIQPGMRDALVAMWVLRVWYENAETRQAKRDSMFSPLLPYLGSVYLSL
ncbi:hypothetical protein FQN50_003442 [Emmonsiellopsis sp. PD_5]|nr:hypothetical protein FQN50_003442 [Emmonsiellopsis sp. PD_5]